jgi:CDP-glycerol glycerophosphotransferase (TagB/SpsB family)
LTWHGIGFKKIGVIADKFFRGKNFLREKIMYYIQKSRYQKYYLILATSETDKKRKVECFKNNNVKILGYPRTDFLIEKIFKQKKIKYKKILYAPTYREKNYSLIPFDKSFLKGLNKKLKKNNLTLLIKRHPKDSRIFLDKKYSNIKDITDKTSDIQEVLLRVDKLITDYSSVVTDFILTKKPVIFYIYDKEKYLSECSNFYYDFFKIAPGPLVKKKENLYRYIINDSWFKNKKYQKNIKQVCENANFTKIKVKELIIYPNIKILDSFFPFIYKLINLKYKFIHLFYGKSGNKIFSKNLLCVAKK